MTIAGSTLLLFVVATVLVVVVVATFVYLARRLKRRRDQILTELAGKPQLVQDRAFNRLAMARREVELLERTGADTTRAHELIAQAQGAFDMHQYPRAYELAQSAHESLVVVRRRGSDAWAPTSPLASPLSRSPPGAGTGAGASSPSPPAATLPRNRAESQFQLRLLDQEVRVAQSDRPREGATLEASNLQKQAQGAFDRGDFTDAFRLALRARRGLGGKVEALPPLPGAVTAGAGLPTPASLDPAAVAEGVAGGERCPNCGYPSRSEDTFCRGCGTPRTPTTCPSCGAHRGRSDTFCGRCGARFTA
jgi:Double zinc ribbon